MNKTKMFYQYKMDKINLSKNPSAFDHILNLLMSDGDSDYFSKSEKNTLRTCVYMILDNNVEKGWIDKCIADSIREELNTPVLNLKKIRTKVRRHGGHVQGTGRTLRKSGELKRVLDSTPTLDSHTRSIRPMDGHIIEKTLSNGETVLFAEYGGACGGKGGMTDDSQVTFHECYWEKGTNTPQVGYKPVKDKKEADLKVSATADKELKLAKAVTPAERRFRDYLISAKTIPMSPVYFELVSHGLSTDHIESIVDRMSINRKYGYDIVGNDLKLKKTTEIFIKEEFKDGVFKFYFAVRIYNNDDKKYVTRKFNITDLV